MWDEMGHCFFFDVDLPESKEAFAVTTMFFNSRLGRKSWQQLMQAVGDLLPMAT
jgi:hypothetical protein